MRRHSTTWQRHTSREGVSSLAAQHGEV